MEAVVFKRKFRWTLEVQFGEVKTKPYFVKVQSRPLQPSTAEDPKRIVTTYFDVIPATHEDFFKCIAAVYLAGGEAFANAKGTTTEFLENVKGTLGTGEMILYDGCGFACEKWQFKGLWPESINFGDLCYSSDPHSDIDVTWRYLECEYTPFTPESPGPTLPNSRQPWPSSGIMGLGKLGDPNIIF